MNCRPIAVAVAVGVAIIGGLPGFALADEGPAAAESQPRSQPQPAPTTGPRIQLPTPPIAPGGPQLFGTIAEEGIDLEDIESADFALTEGDATYTFDVQRMPDGTLQVTIVRTGPSTDGAAAASDGSATSSTTTSTTTTLTLPELEELGCAAGVGNGSSGSGFAMATLLGSVTALLIAARRKRRRSTVDSLASH